MLFLWKSELYFGCCTFDEPLCCHVHEAMRICDRCGLKFKNAFQLGPHRRICNVIRAPEPSNAEPSSAEPPSAEPPSAEPPSAEPPSGTLREIVQRKYEAWGVTRILSEHGPPRNAHKARDYSHMQETWHAYVESTHSCCSSQFWRLQEAVLDQTVNCKDLVMHVVKHLVSAESRQPGWPESFRALRKRIRRKAGVFWDHVLHTHTIDLSQYELPGVREVSTRLSASLTFHFHPNFCILFSVFL